MKGLFVLSGPSGSGKQALTKKACEEMPDIHVTVSCTTRPQGEREIHGVDYYFTPRDEFVARVAAGDFLEWAEYSGDLYGTLRSEIKEGARNIVEIELRGARQIKDLYPEVPIAFVMTPTIEDLRRRIMGRPRAVSPEKLGLRMKRAAEEFVEGPQIADVLILNKDGEIGFARAFELFKLFLSL